MVNEGRFTCTMAIKTEVESQTGLITSSFIIVQRLFKSACTEQQINNQQLTCKRATIR